MFRTHVWLLILIIVVFGLVTSLPYPGGGEHVHFKIHVPHHYDKHTHTHTIVKKIYVPVKEHHEEHSHYAEDAW